ncbi:MAG TPA: hypothetical protein VGN11_08595 [Candidatus Baltobacteraceae bacterium]|jgi:acylaminoacyl-peptidase|nr:hypothetical protein [Candidatus Baltobacteraceae bacterium]
MLARVTDPQLSPDGTRVLYDVRSTDFKADRGVHATWMLDLANPEHPSRLAISSGGSGTARWSPDGHAIYFLSDRSGSTQLWRANAQGTGPVQITKLPVDVQTFRIAPDEKHAIVALAVFPECATLECSAARLAKIATHKPSGRLYTHVFVRHWDTWADGTRNHLYAVQLHESGAASSNAVSLMGSFDGDVPSKPFGDETDFTIAPNSRTVVFFRAPRRT